LRVLCNDTLAILKRTMGASYRVRTDFAPIVDHVMVDPVQLQSALMNLALNARDAMGAQGELLISIENITIDDRYIAQETDITPGHYVRLSVSDDGEGMNLEAQQRAFEPFFTTKSGRGGTGLGLAMVYGFVRQSGGHITLYSEVGHGTSFGVYFPAIHPTGPAQASGPSVGGGIEAFGTGKTVLVVEDNPKVRRLSAQRVRELGFSVVEAQTGDEAYQRLRGGLAVDIVFSDLVMPGELNGYDLAEKIAAEWPDLKVLLTSGYASDVISSKLATGQTYDVLHKPFRFPDLAARLQALLAVSSGT
jgi:CheY-like chemotaxis protein